MALTVVVTLPVGTSAQAGLGKQFVVDLPLPFELDLPLELIDFLPELLRDGCSELFFPSLHLMLPE